MATASHVMIVLVAGGVCSNILRPVSSLTPSSKMHNKGPFACNANGQVGGNPVQGQRSAADSAADIAADRPSAADSVGSIRLNRCTLSDMTVTRLHKIILLFSKFRRHRRKRSKSKNKKKRIRKTQQNLNSTSMYDTKKITEKKRSKMTC